VFDGLLRTVLDKSTPDVFTDEFRDRTIVVTTPHGGLGYVRKLEETLIVALARLGIVAGQRSGLTGVWIQADVHSRCPRCKPEDRRKPAKIAAIGVKVDVRGVSRHGFALNVNPDMEYWDGIIGCGLQDEPIVSLADLFPEPPPMELVKQEVIAAFTDVFGFRV
jgi:lipoate-protein ligase B